MTARHLFRLTGADSFFSLRGAGLQSETWPRRGAQPQLLGNILQVSSCDVGRCVLLVRKKSVVCDYSEKGKLRGLCRACFKVMRNFRPSWDILQNKEITISANGKLHVKVNTHTRTHASHAHEGKPCLSQLATDVLQLGYFRTESYCLFIN